MKIHEYQAKEVLRRFGVAVPEGKVARSADEAAAAFDALESPLAVVKAQIHAGGRGKGGGIKLVRSRDEAKSAAAGMLGKALVTPQTGPEGRVVKTVWVEKGSEIARELYLAIVMDRKTQSPVMLASTEGGMDIEEVAAKHPDKILKEVIHTTHGLYPFQARRLAMGLGMKDAAYKNALKVMAGLSKCFTELDCSIAEINPLIVTKAGEVLALDGKINFDDNALFRHPEVAAYRDLNEEDEKEIAASNFGLNYIALDGNIACMVNGAGLAMATMDMIKLHGGAPANFLDVGGGANKEQVTNAFKILLSDKNVKAVLVNIFGGIMKCDTIAEGVVAAAKEVHLTLPLVVRLEGTRVEEGRTVLKNSGIKLQSAASLDEGARLAVAAVKGGR
jgi:succinyl-CoA synthetase beta subunit